VIFGKERGGGPILDVVLGVPVEARRASSHRREPLVSRLRVMRAVVVLRLPRRR
jgi:hypothetical protein